LFPDQTNPNRPAGGVPLISLPGMFAASSNSNTESSNRRGNKLSFIQSGLYNAAALLASIAAGFDVRKATTKTQAQSL